MNNPTIIVKGLEIRGYTLDCEVYLEPDTDIFDVYSFNWKKDGVAIPAEQHSALTEFYLEEIVSTVVNSLETEGLF